MDRHKRHLDQLLKGIGGEGQLDKAVRDKLLEGKTPSNALGALAAKVQENPTSISDEKIAALLAEGWSEDQIFECVIAAATGAGMVRLRRVLDLLGAKG